MSRRIGQDADSRKNHSTTANPTWGDIFECCFKAQSSKLERLFSLKRGTRDVRALSFELSKMTPQVGLAVHYFSKSDNKSNHHQWNHKAVENSDRYVSPDSP